MSSRATWTGTTFPGIARVEMVDEDNGYVLAVLNPWTTYQPGLDQETTVTPLMTLTNAEFAALSPLSITASTIKRGRYDATRHQWTYPIIQE